MEITMLRAQHMQVILGLPFSREIPAIWWRKALKINIWELFWADCNLLSQSFWKIKLRWEKYITAARFVNNDNVSVTPY